MRALPVLVAAPAGCLRIYQGSLDRIVDVFEGGLILCFLAILLRRGFAIALPSLTGTGAVANLPRKI